MLRWIHHPGGCLTEAGSGRWLQVVVVFDSRADFCYNCLVCQHVGSYQVTDELVHVAFWSTHTQENHMLLARVLHIVCSEVLLQSCLYGLNYPMLVCLVMVLPLSQNCCMHANTYAA